MDNIHFAKLWEHLEALAKSTECPLTSHVIQMAMESAQAAQGDLIKAEENRGNLLTSQEKEHYEYLCKRFAEDQNLHEGEIALIRVGKPIEAIKALRARIGRHNIPLVVAKDLVQDYQREHKMDVYIP